MSNEWKGSIGFPWVAAARLFAMAHDFALLSEEEECENLTKGFLDSDQNYKFGESGIPSFDTSDESNPGCVLSSEFSAQCLLVRKFRGCRCCLPPHRNSVFFNNSSLCGMLCCTNRSPLLYSFL
jgi:hypothetical protein